MNTLDISNSKPREVYNMLIDSINSMKPIKVKYVESSRVEEVYLLSFDDVKYDIVHSKDSPDSNNYVIRVPVGEEKLYKGKVLPGKGFINKLVSEVVPRGFGILDINVMGFESYINESDNRFLKDKIIFKESDHFIFDYDKNVYVQIPEKEFVEVSRDLKFKKGFQVSQIKNNLVKEYVVRERKLYETLGVLKHLYQEKSEELFYIKSLDYKFEDKVTIIYYLQKWKSFLEDVDVWLNLKEIYSIIDSNEKKLLKKQSVIFLKNINESLRMLEYMPDVLSSYHTRSSYEKELKFIDEKLLELNRSLIERDGQREGYFILETEAGVWGIVENFIEMEKRNMVSDVKYTSEEIEKEKNLFLNNWIERHK